jgi:hypothetical protein
MPPPPKDGFLGMTSKPRLFGPDKFQTTRNPNSLAILQNAAPTALSGYLNSAVNAMTPIGPPAMATPPTVTAPAPAPAPATNAKPAAKPAVALKKKADSPKQGVPYEALNPWKTQLDAAKTKAGATPAPKYSGKARATPELRPATMPGGKMKYTNDQIIMAAKDRGRDLSKLSPADKARVLSIRAQSKW